MTTAEPQAAAGYGVPAAICLLPYYFCLGAAPGRKCYNKTNHAILTGLKAKRPSRTVIYNVVFGLLLETGRKTGEQFENRFSIYNFEDF